MFHLGREKGKESDSRTHIEGEGFRERVGEMDRVRESSYAAVQNCIHRGVTLSMLQVVKVHLMV